LKSSDSLIVSAILFAAIMSFAGLTEAPPWITGIVLVAALLLVWIYFAKINPSQAQPRPRLRDDDIGQLRGEALQEFADSLPRAIAVIDKNAKIVYANKAAQDLISADMIGRPLSAYLRTSAVRSHLAQAFEGQIPPSLSVNLVNPTERFLDVDFSEAISVFPNTPRSNLVFAVIADRTQANKDREQRADFLANASHELKTPIASLKGYIETLRGHAKDDPAAREKFLGIMGDQAERMERLVNDLLSLRRIESSEHIAPSETADLRKALEAARDSLELVAEARGVDLVVDLPKEEIAPTSGKTDECIQLFLNLIENAIKLSPKGATVRARLEKLPSWTGTAFARPIEKDEGFRRIVNRVPHDDPVWRVVISDEGPGFSLAHLPRIGERFYRVAGDLPAQEKGTGLGLAIVKHIVMRHRAGLFVRSLHKGGSEHAPSGTSFSVVFKVSN